MIWRHEFMNGWARAGKTAATFEYMMDILKAGGIYEYYMANGSSIMFGSPTEDLVEGKDYEIIKPKLLTMNTKSKYEQVLDYSMEAIERYIEEEIPKETEDQDWMDDSLKSKIKKIGEMLVAYWDLDLKYFPNEGTGQIPNK